MLGRNRSRHGRTVVVAAVAAAAVVGLGACGSSGTSGTSGKATPGNKMTGKLTIMGFGTNGDDVAMSRFHLAESAMPHVKVSAPNGGFNDQSFLSEEASGNPPDLVYMNGADVGTYAAKGAIQPLTSCLKSEHINMSQYITGARQQVTLKGTVYGIPEFSDDITVLVNDSAVAKAGLKPSDVNTSNWPNLLKVAKKLEVLKGGKLATVGFDPNKSLFPIWAKANGGSIVSANGQKAELNSPQNVQALTMMVNLIKEQQGSNKFYSFENTMNFFGANNPIATDQIAAITYQDWYYNVLASTSPKVKVTAEPFLSRQGKPLDYVTGSAWVIPKGSKNPQAACLWAKKMTETSTWMHAATNRIKLYSKKHYIFTGLQTDNKIADAKIIKLFHKTVPKSSPFYQPVTESYNVEKYSFTVPASNASEAVYNAWNTAVNSAMSGQMSPKKALDQAQSTAQTALNQAKSNS